MELFYRKYNADKNQTVIILHGLYGASDNWVSIAKQLNKDYSVFIPDLRNHGNSPHSNEFNYDAMSDDLNEFIASNNIKNPVIIGHSMGGKLAMNYVYKYPNKIKKLIIIDIAPKNYSYKIKDDFHKKLLQTIAGLDLSKFKNRIELKNEIENLVKEKRQLHLILKNIKRTKEGFEWKINIKAISTQINNILNETFTNELSKETLNIDTLFIKGENSDYILESDFENIKRIYPNVKFATIKNASHWIHAEQPDMLIEEINIMLS